LRTVAGTFADRPAYFGAMDRHAAYLARIVDQVEADRAYLAELQRHLRGATLAVVRARHAYLASLSLLTQIERQGMGVAMRARPAEAASPSQAPPRPPR
jgi:hypothetical protein